MWANQLPMAPLFITEVKDAVFKNNSPKAPGIDGLPASVWQQLWPVIQNKVYCLFKRSLEEGIAGLEDRQDHPLAQIEQRDYSILDAYRPTSLLAALGKALELVIATRISYFAAECGLLPYNHFGGRK
jgi:hypothetical protein